MVVEIYNLALSLSTALEWPTLLQHPAFACRDTTFRCHEAAINQKVHASAAGFFCVSITK